MIFALTPVARGYLDQPSCFTGMGTHARKEPLTTRRLLNSNNRRLHVFRRINIRTTEAIETIGLSFLLEIAGICKGVFYIFD